MNDTKLLAVENRCIAHTTHAPRAVYHHRHHVILKGWTNALVLPEGRTVILCPHGHDAVHDALWKAMRGETFIVGPAIRLLVDEAVAFYAQNPLMAKPRLLDIARITAEGQP